MKNKFQIKFDDLIFNKNEKKIYKDILEDASKILFTHMEKYVPHFDESEILNIFLNVLMFLNVSTLVNILIINPNIFSLGSESEEFMECFFNEVKRQVNFNLKVFINDSQR